MRKIVFTNYSEVPKEYLPKPASQFIPDWYKKLEGWLGKPHRMIPEQSMVPLTIKKCIPVFDSITAGYIIVSPVDVQVSQVDGGAYFNWSANNMIEFHPVEQAPEHPQRNGMLSYPKWINPFGIKTPKGYSTLFVQPFHRDSPFTILPGVVDTDTYRAPVNFPFVLNDPNWEGMIPAGTPIAQVIPFKRDSWKMEYGKEKEKKDIFDIQKLHKSKFFHAYKSMFWIKKEYK